MAVFELYSKEQKRLRGEVPEILVYDDLPNKFRVQVIHIIKDTIGRDTRAYHKDAEKSYDFICKSLSREYGKHYLTRSEQHDEYALFDFFQNADVELALDVIQFTFQYIENVIKPYDGYTSYVKVEMEPDEAIEELNVRFRENGLGFQYAAGKLIRIDSTYMHKEVVLPAITLMWNNTFANANEEYLKAHEHYRHGRNKECLAECLKAFESTLKIIFHAKGWTYNQNDTSKTLIKTCYDNQLIPSYLQTQFTSLRSLLESGIPTIRNKVGGHGQGQASTKADDELTRYALNLTGANIIYLIENSGIK